ncbi:MAG TPA: hypothetical protein VF367_05895 [Candidatus Limnocylindria bacterium]|jgi:hypothetical protein
MVELASHAPAHIGASLTPIRAAIDVVAAGAARSIVVHDVAGALLLPAARALGRAAGVRVEAIPWPDREGCDIRIRSRSGG